MKPNACRIATPRRKSGFTLTELLVVILIVVVLAGLLFPLVNNMKSSANKTECMNRLRSWGTAFAGYAADNDGKVEFRKWYPISWDAAGVSPYVQYWTGGSVDLEGRNHMGAYEVQQRMRWCPSVKWTTGNSPVCYSTIRPTDNGALIPNQTEYSMTRIKNPARFMMMTETITGTLTNLSAAADFTSKVKPLFSEKPMRHKGGVNALMADFSVRAMTWKEIERGTSYWSSL